MSRASRPGKFALSLGLLPFALAQNLASDPPEVRVSSRPYQPTIRAETNVVQVGVVVRDAKGKTVGGLKQEDFHIFDEGKERPIAGFVVNERAAVSSPIRGAAVGAAAPTASLATSVNKALPTRFIALYFDDLGTPAGDLMRTKRAAQRFVQDGSDPGDRIAVFTSRDGRVTEFLSDKVALAAAIEKVQSHPRFGERGASVCPRITPYDAYLIANHMSQQALQAKVLEAQSCDGPPPPPPPGRSRPLAPQVDTTTQLVTMQSEQIWSQVEIASRDSLDAIGGVIDSLSHLPGARMLLMVSSGFITGTMENVEDALADRALRAGVVINAIDAKGLFVEEVARPFGEDPISQWAPPQVFAWEAISATDSKEVPNKIMIDLAAATGGLFFHNNNDYSHGFRELGSLPEVSYILTFHLDESSFNSKYHKLKMKLASANSYQLEYRPGYFAVKDESKQIGRRAELDRLAGALDAQNGFPASASIRYGVKTAAGLTPVHVQMHVEVNALHFSQAAGRRDQDLLFVAVLYDKEGRMVAAREGEMNFALTEAKFASLAKDGVNAVLNLEAPSGTYRLRLVALDAQNKAAALAYAVAVP